MTVKHGANNKNAHNEEMKTLPELKSRLVFVLLTMASVFSFVMSPQNTLTLIFPIIVSMFLSVNEKVRHRLVTNTFPCSCETHKKGLTANTQTPASTHIEHRCGIQLSFDPKVQMLICDVAQVSAPNLIWWVGPTLEEISHSICDNNTELFFISD